MTDFLKKPLSKAMIKALEKFDEEPKLTVFPQIVAEIKAWADEQFPMAVLRSKWAVVKERDYREVNG